MAPARTDRNRPIVKPRPPLGPSNPEVESESERVSRAAAGDRDAFRSLVEGHRHRAYALALRLTRSPADAEEVAQDAFVRAWRALPRFRGEARFGTWLHRIVVRVAMDRAAALRRRRGREIVVEGPTLEGLAAAPAPAKDRGATFDRLIRGLPETQRLVVSLYYGEDRSVQQVAEVLGMPENTVKTHLSRARSALRAGWLGCGGLS